MASLSLISLLTLTHSLTHAYSPIFLFTVVLFSCCKSYHDHAAVAPTPMQVVRSRFCAFKYNKLDYIIATTAPTHQVLTHSNVLTCSLNQSINRAGLV